jgi:hypothetical protein
VDVRPESGAGQVAGYDGGYLSGKGMIRTPLRKCNSLC